MEAFLMKQVETLTEQNAALNLKIQSLLEQMANPTTKNNAVTTASEDNIPNYEEWIKSFDQILTFNDIKYDTYDFVKATMHCLMKIFEKNNCIKTLNKKRKIMSIKRDGKWCEVNFIEFVEIVKKIIDNCIKVFHRLMLNHKKKNPNDELYDIRHSNIIVCMFSDINDYKENIANKLVEMLL